MNAATGLPRVVVPTHLGAMCKWASIETRYTLRPPPEPAPEYQKGGLDGKNTLIKRGALGAPLVSGNVEKRKAIN